MYSVFCLNNIVWWTNNTINRGINGNRIESECFNMTLSGYGTIIEYDCFNLIMGGYICYGNFFKSGFGILPQYIRPLSSCNAEHTSLSP